MEKNSSIKEQKNYFIICIIMAIGLVVMSVVSYALFDRNAKETVDKNLEYFTHQSFFLIEERLAIVEKIMVELSFDKEIKAFLESDDEADVMKRAEIISGISAHITGENNIRNIFIINKEKGYTISDSGYSGDIDIFFEYILEVQKPNVENMKKTISDIDNITMARYDRNFKNSSFLVLAPMYDSALRNVCVIGAIVESHFLANILERVKISSECVLLITNKNGEIISASNETVFNREVFTKESYSEVKRDDGDYSVFCSESDKYSIVYYNLVPKNMHANEYTKVRSTLLILISVSVILLAVLWVLFSKKNYKLLNALILKMRSLNPDIEGEEAEYIESAIGGLYEEEKRINRLIKDNYDIIKEGVTRQLIYGGSVDGDKADSLMKYLGFDIHEGYKRVVITVLDDVFSAKAFMKEISERFLSDVLMINEEETIIAVFISNKEEIQELIEFYNSKENVFEYAYVGNAYKNAGDIINSYNEASELQKYTGALNDRIFVYENVVSNCHKDIDLWEAAPFVKLIESGCTGEAITLLEDMRRGLTENARYILKSDLKRIYVQLIKTVGESFASAHINEEVTEERLLNADVAELETGVKKYFVWVGELLMKQETGTNEYNRVIEYIKAQNGFDFDLNQIASELGINPSYLSRWFKEYTGETYTEYIKRLKINEVIRLLTEEDMSLKEIAERVNYSSDSALAKAFKKKMGCTPKEFKERRAK